jgi:MinD-like ATPase involved in chromosome partitioning or flagellar assembly
MICTFYSYKGGVGRSMALANVAEWMYLRRGLRVVIVDWDLEAPGLESFFPSDNRQPAVPRQPGLIDLLLDYIEDLPYLRLPPEDAPREEVASSMAEQLPPLRSRLVQLRRPGGSDQSALWLLPAGRREGDAFPAYARAVQRFDWSGFYERHRGEAFFEWLRSQLLADDLADVVLIDTRTGISEMGGVATRQLADVIVSFCVLNTQNIEGVATVTRSFLREDVREARGRPVQVLVVPSRIENTEIDARNQAKVEFSEAMEALRPEAMVRDRRMFWDLAIPQVPKYAYKEKLAVGAADSAEEIEQAYAELGAQILALAPAGSTARERSEPVPATKAEPISLPTISNLPSRLSLVVGRDSLLSDMRSRLTTTGAPLVLYGLGGIGKTALATEYAYRFQPDYEATWWIDASTPESVARGYADLAGQLGLTGSPGALIEGARRWLAANGGWLVILDGAENPERFEKDVPHERRGHVILTSRNPVWGTLATTLEVPALARGDAVEFLRRRTGDVDPVAGRELAAALGDHPLALVVAAAYMDATGRSAAEFLDIFRKEGVDFLARGAEASAGTESVAASWERSYRDLLHDPLARDLLAFCSMLASESVPLNLIATGATKRSPAFLSASSELDRAIVGLRRYSFATMRSGELLVNPLLEALVRRWLGPAEAGRWALHAVVEMRGALQAQTPGYKDTVERLLPHAHSAADHAVEWNANAVEMLELLRVIAAHEEAVGQSAKARETLNRAVLSARRLLNAKHPLIDESMRNRAEFLIRQGDLAGAAGALTDDIAWARASGPKSALVRVLGDTGVIALRRGDLTAATKLTHEAIAIAEEAAMNDELARLLVNAAVLQLRKGAHEDAFVLAERARNIARETLTSRQAAVITPVADAVLLHPAGEPVDGILGADLAR